ncbi:MAG: YtxH domain-containing protein [Bacteroidetes bacterium]|nr:YtxH domain-containing protein [Bacteroidota bacterium]
MKEGKIVLGVLAGLAAGAVLGILLAPDKGSNTRKKITGKGSKYMDDIKEKLNDVYHSILDKSDSLVDNGEEMVNKAKSKTEDFRKTVHNATS